MPKAQKQAKGKEPHACPFCDEEMVAADLPYCQVCGVRVFLCPQCKKPVTRDKETCPSCGARIKNAAK